MPTPTPTPPPDLPTREARAYVYRIDADLVDITATARRHEWLPGVARVHAKVDIDGTDYVWRVDDARRYRIGDSVIVTVPA